MQTEDKETGKRLMVHNTRKKHYEGTAVPGGSGERRAAIWTTRLRIVWWGLGVIVLSSMLAACRDEIYRAIENSKMFALEGIEILGNERIPSNEISEMAGIPGGTNILTLRSEEISHRLEIHPWIERVSIIKRYPHRLMIKVQERKPGALVAIGDLYYVDAQGVVFHKVSPRDTRDLPVLTGFRKEDVLSRMHKTYEPVTKAMDLLRIIQCYPGIITISEIHFDPRRGWTLYPLNPSVPVYLGFGDLERKILRLVRVYGDLLIQNPSPDLVDLSFPCQVVVRKIPEEKGMCTTVKAAPSKTRPLDSGPPT